jgi:hypothetical protein
MLAKAIWDHNEVAFADYAKRLAINRSRIEELLWVLSERKTNNVTTPGAVQSVLDLRVASMNNNIMPVREIIEKLRKGEIRMDDLSAQTQTMVRRGALEMKNGNRG